MSLRITITGTGTSLGVPVLGCDCEVCTSTDPRDQRLRTAALIQTSTTNLAIDVGPDFRQQMLATGIRSLDGILLTHEHNDHLIGLDDVRPFNFVQRKPIDIYGLARVNQRVQLRFPYIFAAEKYPGAPSLNLHEIDAGQTFMVGDIEIQALAVSHGALPILGYKFGELVYITDANQISEQTLEQIGRPRVLVINAMHEKTHHSHFNLAQAIEISETIAARQTYLVHMSHRMGLHATKSKALPKAIQLAHDGLEVELT